MKKQYLIILAAVICVAVCGVFFAGGQRDENNMTKAEAKLARQAFDAYEEKNYTIARPLFKKLADKYEEPSSMWMYSHMLTNLMGFPLESINEGTFQAAQSEAAEYKARGEKTLAEWIKKGGKSEAVAERYYGWLYNKGFCMPRNIYMSAVHYYKAAELGDSLSMVRIAAYYSVGYVTERGQWKDYKNALKWYLKAVDADRKEVFCNIGNLYADGDEHGSNRLGLEKNHAEALKWYMKAVDNGDVDAYQEIGHLYYHGCGGDYCTCTGAARVEQDLKAAKKWYKKAADEGSELAKERLASDKLKDL